MNKLFLTITAALLLTSPSAFAGAVQSAVTTEDTDAQAHLAILEEQQKQQQVLVQDWTNIQQIMNVIGKVNLDQQYARTNTKPFEDFIEFKNRYVVTPQKATNKPQKTGIKAPTRYSRDAY